MVSIPTETPVTTPAPDIVAFDTKSLLQIPPAATSDRVSPEVPEQTLCPPVIVPAFANGLTEHPMLQKQNYKHLKQYMKL